MSYINYGLERFLWFDKCPLIVIPSYKRTAQDFVNIVYEGY